MKNNQLLLKIFSFSAILIICILAWFEGLIIQIGDAALFESKTSRLILISILLSTWIGKQIFDYFKSKKAENSIIASCYKSSLNQKNSGEPNDFSAFKNEVAQALCDLKNQRLLNHYQHKPLNSLPWYLVLGAPGYGKTTIIKNSGLEAAFLKQSTNQNVEQLSNFSWHITEQAVFLEITRYDKGAKWNASNNNTAWLEILKTLKKYKVIRAFRNHGIVGNTYGYSIKQHF